MLGRICVSAALNSTDLNFDCMALRFAEFRIDAGSLQTFADGSIKVVGQLSRPGIFAYRNADGTERREYRPADEVFKKAALDTFASAPVTINHPRMPDGQRLVTAESWKSVAIGHAGENVREDGGHVVADLYIRDAGAVARVKSGDLRAISLGYNVDYDATPGTTPEGQRYDGVQRNIRGNHVALLPSGIAPRGGSDCMLRLDSSGDEIEEVLNSNVTFEELKVKITVLESELATARTDAAEVPALKTKLAAAETALVAATALAATPERLDALLAERTAAQVAAKALADKRAVIAKRTPALADRLDAMGAEALDAILAVYAGEPHPSMTTAVAPVIAPVGERSDAVDPKAIPKVADMHAAFAKKSQNAWKGGVSQ